MLEQKLKQFLYGRYGMDQLGIALIVLYLLLAVTSSILMFAGAIIAEIILWVLSLAVIVFALYRTYSKKIFVRRKENAAFLKLWNPVAGWLKTRYRRFKERKTYRYRKCPKCHATLRLPAKKGKHGVSCPKCHNEFSVNIL